MSWPKLLVLVRHAESIGNTMPIEQRVKLDISTSEFPLTNKGKEQARITGEYLNKNFGTFSTYITSPYLRTTETAKLLYPDVEFQKDPRLIEVQRGIRYVMTEKQIKKKYPEEIIRKRKEGLYYYRPLGGENWIDVEIRIRSFLNRLRSKKILIVVHGNWLVIFQKIIDDLSIEKAIFNFELGGFENASVTIYENKTVNRKSKLVLVEENIIPWKGKL